MRKTDRTNNIFPSSGRGSVRQEETTPAVADTTIPASAEENEPDKRLAGIPCPNYHRFHCCWQECFNQGHYHRFTPNAGIFLDKYGTRCSGVVRFFAPVLEIRSEVLIIYSPSLLSKN